MPAKRKGPVAPVLGRPFVPPLASAEPLGEYRREPIRFVTAVGGDARVPAAQKVAQVCNDSATFPGISSFL